MANEIAPVDFDKLLSEEVATEYSESERLMGYIKALLCDHSLLDGVFLTLLQRLDIDKMSGINLDVIGAIVGQPRTVIAASGVVFFGFSPDPQANSFGDPNNPTVGGRLRAPGESLTGNKRLIDSEYRVFIRARIAKNHVASTPDAVISGIKFILNDDTPVYVTTAYPRPGHGRIMLGRVLNLNEQYLLTEGDLMPVTAGVTYHLRDFDTRVFGFKGASFPVGGFGDPAVPGSGAPFARLLS